MDEVWFVVTPHNPHKKKKNLLEDYHRLAMVEMAIEDYPKLRASNVEFKLPQPNYTINTLVHLEEKYPRQQFCLIMGEDNLKSFPKWKNYDVILDRYPIYVYPRISEGVIDNQFYTPVEGGKGVYHEKITMVNAPIIELSSTLIRKGVKEKKNIRPMLTKEVWKYVDEMNFYRK
ncbi:nicotinate-nucleotide adenylyltransferase [Aequorivita viscosa]|uniref:nicotinate-nucleotide adenylyltransferase n=1 Tax=Aequorivita viscosa TaxID=797419 RepID=A0A1M6DK93_9FLAO|nr:nicotinate-nucleotide adenylyltransferase [Aequorivita viscosa]SHI73408.1 nicotinate-nucleotide adenylyltransferase [Aequorivita viscosa]